ncbi:MAG: DUF1902 domain-containing protein [Methylophaga sp.]|nr:DUF1902 domain-containing protein [Methylophaga sp.]
MSFRIDVTHDAEENVYIATSEDIPGLVIEAESFSQLRDEVSEAIPTLLSFGRDSDHDHTSADVLYKDHIAIA